jgi:hypothetical protein
MNEREGREERYLHEKKYVSTICIDLNRFVEYRSPFTRKETLPVKKPI